MFFSNTQDTLLVDGSAFKKSKQALVGFDPLLSFDVPLTISDKKEKPRPIRIAASNVRAV